MLPFDANHRWPEGFDYRGDFITAQEQRALADTIAKRVAFRTFEMRGVTAKRRVAFFGEAYDKAEPAVAIPEFLLPLRARLAEWAGVTAGEFARVDGAVRIVLDGQAAELFVVSGVRVTVCGRL